MDFINIIGTFFDNSIEHVVALAHLIKDLRLGKNQLDINEDIYTQIQNAKETKEKGKGYFDSYSSLALNIPSPEIGDWAIVKNSENGKWYIYKCVVRGYWKETDEQYTSEVNLNGYTKDSDFKTINGQSILGEGDIETGDKYEIASLDNDGLLSKELYVQLITLRNETIPKMLEHIDNILKLFDDEQTPENILAIIDRYNLICEFIASLGDSDNGLILELILADIDALLDDVDAIESDISDNIKADLTSVKDDMSDIQEAIRKLNSDLELSNSDIALTFVSVYNRIDEVEREAGGDFSQIRERITDNENAINSEISRALRVEDELSLRITDLEQNPVVPENLAGHIFLTQEEYDALTTYEKDTLYIILEPKNSEGSSFGDAFPIILA